MLNPRWSAKSRKLHYLLLPRAWSEFPSFMAANSRYCLTLKAIACQGTDEMRSLMKEREGRGGGIWCPRRSRKSETTTSHCFVVVTVSLKRNFSGKQMHAQSWWNLLSFSGGRVTLTRTQPQQANSRYFTFKQRKQSEIPSGGEDDNFLLTIHIDDTRIAVTLKNKRQTFLNS